MSQNEIEQTEISIKEAEKLVARGEMALRLERNSDFKKLIIDGYFNEEAVRLTHYYSEVANDPDRAPDALDALKAVGFLKRWLSGVVVMGNNAQRAIEEDKQTLEELRAEELEAGLEG